MAANPVASFLAGFNAVETFETNKEIRADNDMKRSRMKKLWARDDKEYERQELDRYRGEKALEFQHTFDEVWQGEADRAQSLFDSGDMEAYNTHKDKWFGEGSHFLVTNEALKKMQAADPDFGEHMALAAGKDPGAGMFANSGQPVATVGVSQNHGVFWEINTKTGEPQPMTKHRTDANGDPVDFFKPNMAFMHGVFGPHASGPDLDVMRMMRLEIGAENPTGNPAAVDNATSGGTSGGTSVSQSGGAVIDGESEDVTPEDTTPVQTEQNISDAQEFGPKTEAEHAQWQAAGKPMDFRAWRAAQDSNKEARNALDRQGEELTSTVFSPRSTRDEATEPLLDAAEAAHPGDTPEGFSSPQAFFASELFSGSKADKRLQEARARGDKRTEDAGGKAPSTIYGGFPTAGGIEQGRADRAAIANILDSTGSTLLGIGEAAVDGIKAAMPGTGWFAGITGIGDNKTTESAAPSNADVAKTGDLPKFTSGAPKSDQLEIAPKPTPQAVVQAATTVVPGSTRSRPRKPEPYQIYNAAMLVKSGKLTPDQFWNYKETGRLEKQVAEDLYFVNNGGVTSGLNRKTGAVESRTQTGPIGEPGLTTKELIAAESQIFDAQTSFLKGNYYDDWEGKNDPRLQQMSLDQVNTTLDLVGAPSAGQQGSEVRANRSVLNSIQAGIDMVARFNPDVAQTIDMVFWSEPEISKNNAAVGFMLDQAGITNADEQNQALYDFGYTYQQGTHLTPEKYVGNVRKMLATADGIATAMRRGEKLDPEDAWAEGMTEIEIRTELVKQRLTDK